MAASTFLTVFVELALTFASAANVVSCVDASTYFSASHQSTVVSALVELAVPGRVSAATNLPTTVATCTAATASTGSGARVLRARSVLQVGALQVDSVVRTASEIHTDNGVNVVGTAAGQELVDSVVARLKLPREREHWQGMGSVDDRVIILVTAV